MPGYSVFKDCRSARDFKGNPPNLDELREAFPEFAYLFVGQFGETPNGYFNGQVVSWPLVGSREMRAGLVQDSTLGMAETGEYEFGTNHHERITVLDGSFRVYVDGLFRGVFPTLSAFDADGDKLKIKIPVNSFFFF